MTTDEDAPPPAEEQTNAVELSAEDHQALLDQNGGLLRGLLAGMVYAGAPGRRG